MWQSIAVFAVIIAGAALFLGDDLKVPTLPETNWGSGKAGKESTEIRPFKINVPKEAIEDLKYRLENRRPFTQPLEDVAWTYGISTKFLNTVLDYWKDEYNWTERQQLLNKYPQFVTNVQGLDIHFYHVKPSNLPKNRNIRVLPLLIIHGWPGSVVEFQKIIPILTTPSPKHDFVFEVVAPSLPGYGFSQGAVRPGMGSGQIAVIFKNLMQRLGFDKYYVQGGDWGAITGANLAALYPEKVTGLHSNMCNSFDLSTIFWMFIGNYIPFLVVESEHYSRYYPFSNVMKVMVQESGYFHIQATKPDTIGTALTSSPDALAAYILEKFSTWTNKDNRDRDDGALIEKYKLNELLDNVMMYWVPNSITTSVRLYAENFSSAYRALQIEKLPVKVPTACADFPGEPLHQPKGVLKHRYPNIIQYTYMPRGGHFAAFEEPQLLADDIFNFVKTKEGMEKPSL